MKKIDFILNALRFSLKEVLMLLFLIWVIWISWYVESEILAFEDKNKNLKKVIYQKQQENEQYSYIEEILAQHHEQLTKFKSIKSLDLFWLQKEIELLVPRWIQINETKLSEGEFVIRWLSPNLRTVDFLVSILNMYNNHYGGFDGEVLLESVNKKDTLQSFRIKWKLDYKSIINKIYSNDIDWDWVIDSVIEEVINSSWVKQKKSIINDLCPFTPSFNIVIGKLIKSNPSLVQSFPYYSENYKKWYFDFNNKTGCLKSWDVKININN